MELRRYLGTATASGLPKHHWRLVASTPDQAEFVHGRLEGENGLRWLGLERVGGGWKVLGPFECFPSTLRDGNPATEWTLYPGAPAPDPSAESIVVGIHEQACTGGRNPISHLERPYVRYRKRTVLVMFWVEPLEGPHTCPGNPVGKFRLKLPGPLGNRRLLDGATYPPRRVEPGEDPYGYDLASRSAFLRQ